MALFWVQLNFLEGHKHNLRASFDVGGFEREVLRPFLPLKLFSRSLIVFFVITWIRVGNIGSILLDRFEKKKVLSFRRIENFLIMKNCSLSTLGSLFLFVREFVFVNRF